MEPFHRHYSCQPMNETLSQAERDPKGCTRFDIRSVRPHWSCRSFHGKGPTTAQGRLAIEWSTRRRRVTTGFFHKVPRVE